MTDSRYLAWLAQAAPPPEPRTPRETTRMPLVLGYADGYGPAEVAAFVLSLRRYYDGPAALFMQAGPEVDAFLAAHRIERLTPSRSQGWRPHVVVARFADLAVALEQRADAGAVLVCDVRDIVFQGDPFMGDVAELTAFVEKEDGPIREHVSHKWTKACLGAGAASAIAERPVLCVGTILGARAAVARAIRVMLWLQAIPRSGLGGSFGADTASFNLAVHGGLINAAIEQNYGRVATIGASRRDLVRVDDGLILCGPNARACPIVHQYDRDPHASALVARLYPPPSSAPARTAGRDPWARFKRLKISLDKRWREWR